MFTQNVGTIDKGIRVVAGLTLLAFAVLGDAPTRWFGLVGIVPLATALLGTCPLYTLLGISTCPDRRPG
jgi:hypothetical protein